MAISYNGDITVVLDMQHRTPGNLRAFVQASLRSLRTGKTSDVRFRGLHKGAQITFSRTPKLTRRSRSQASLSAMPRTSWWRTARSR